MQVDIHVDDLGLYDTGPTALAGLATLHESGYLQGVSVVATGAAFDSARAFLRQLPTLECAVHLNLLEGRALSSRESIPHLVDRNGNFRHTFASLWSFHQSESELRAELVRQIYREASAQIYRVRESCGLDHVTVDSHRYAHLLPFFWPVLVQHALELGVTGIRIVNEPPVAPRRMRTLAMNLLSLNPLKRALLNHLSARLMPALRLNGLAHADYSIGVSCSGRMNADCVSRALERVRHTSRVPDPRVEVVFHPLRAVRSDTGDEERGREYTHFYASEQRAAEMRALASQEFPRIVTAYRCGAVPESARRK